jgi:hypothetical protein
VGTDVLGPVPHVKLIREPASLRIEPQKCGVLGRPIVAHLPEDEGAVPDNLQIGPRMGLRRAEARE